MAIFRMRQCGAAAAIAAMFVGMVVSSGSAQTPTPSANDLDPKVLAYKLPDQIAWKDDPTGRRWRCWRAILRSRVCTSCW